RAELETLHAQVLSAKGENKEARVHAERAAALFQGTPEREPWWFGRVYGTLGHILLKNGEAAAAARAHEAQGAAMERSFGADSGAATQARMQLGDALVAAGEDERALHEIDRALAHTDEPLERGHLLVAAGKAAEHLGRRADARKRYQDAEAVLDGHASSEE